MGIPNITKLKVPEDPIKHCLQNDIWYCRKKIHQLTGPRIFLPYFNPILYKISNQISAFWPQPFYYLNFTNIIMKMWKIRIRSLFSSFPSIIMKYSKHVWNLWRVEFFYELFILLSGCDFRTSSINVHINIIDLIRIWKLISIKWYVLTIIIMILVAISRRKHDFQQRPNP